VTDSGEDLPTLAGSPQRSSFDWSSLHEILEQVLAGRWTTYGDLASTIGTAAQPLGGHIMNCADCSNAWRVLGADGRPSPGFAWSDPERKDTQQDALEAEGVPFICDHADSRSRLPREQLTAMDA